MQKNKKLSLSLITQSTSTKTPQYKVIIDGIELTDPIEQTEKGVTYNKEFADIDNIEIYFQNKEPNDTRVVDGVIVEDLLLIIDRLEIDGIDLTNKISKISNYVDNSGKRHYTHTYITFNGCMKIRLHRNLLYTDWLSGLL